MVVVLLTSTSAWYPALTPNAMENIIPMGVRRTQEMIRLGQEEEAGPSCFPGARGYVHVFCSRIKVRILRHFVSHKGALWAVSGA